MSHSNLLNSFQNLVTSDGSDLSKAKDTIAELKIWASSITYHGNSSDAANLADARRFEELLIIYGIRTKNFSELENAYKRLRLYYEDYSNILTKSSEQDKVIAIYLLYLLSFNRFSDFHIELEKLTEDLKNNQYIQFSIKLEQWLAVGSYSNVLQATKNSPFQYFNVFLERILETLRFEISRSAEKAYSSLSLDDAKVIFSIQDTNTLKKFIESEQKHANEKGMEWKIEGNTINFIPLDANSNSLAFTNGIPDILKYANELEKIV